jgi:putative methionine-R-sulfoxide reductase with GAF domain
MIKKNFYKNAEKMINEILKSDKSTILQDLVEMLYNIFDKYNWIGIYFVKDNYLLLGPWKGKIATNHIKIPIGKGICGSAAKSGNTELINNVKNDERYLACFINTKSEIVVPIKIQNKVIGEIDIDSDYENSFDNDDKKLLEKIANNQNFIKNIFIYINTQDNK